MNTKEFLHYYNQNIPAKFPLVNLSLLKRFYSTHKGIFSVEEDWSIEKHRKRMMDWLESA